MSRAKAALRKAKQTGDDDQVTAARDRLTAARQAHQDAKHTAAAHDTADQCGDVTDHTSSTTKDTDMGHQDQPRRIGFTIHNVNSVTGNARVGSQHDVTGIGPDLDDDQVADVVADALAKVQRAVDRVHRATGHGQPRSNTNVASGDDVVAQQVGFRFGR
ncbi:hypothetical protein [Umezawaea tangerina]|uniref:hypothetical protein n=1 Tax=Umezawaea tangerina TaxID=84725 RepID=UPI000D081757|nr:hypothetical protein [Umezawaea tangerina]